MEHVDAAGRRLEIARRIFRVDATLDHVSAQLDRRLHGKLVAARDANLLLHQIHSGEHLRHRVLDLDAGIHFHEVERLVFVEEHLDGTGTDVVDRLRSLYRRLSHSLAQVLG